MQSTHARVIFGRTSVVLLATVYLLSGSCSAVGGCHAQRTAAQGSRIRQRVGAAESQP